MISSCVLVSAKTGEGLDGLRAAIEEELPERDRVVRVSVPYSRGDLVARAHAAGEVTRVEHGPDGTLLEARVPPELAAELERFPALGTPTSELAEHLKVGLVSDPPGAIP